MNKVLMIAEAGVNHNGELALAKQLIAAAAEAGADAVKFQTFQAGKFVSQSASKAEYQQQTTDQHESQREMLARLELSREEHETLVRYCRQKNVLFLSSPFDRESIVLLRDLGLELFKIPSGEITNLPYLREIGALRKPIILSTGMATLGEIEQALQVLVSSGTPKDAITVLHCNTDYPTPMADVNLRAMLTIRQAFQVKVGYSDHTLGIEVPIAAVALGATVIEKHFTLDRGMSGPDHKASVEPAELKTMIAAIRNIEQALGDGIKRPSSSERKNIPIARKSIVASKNILKGQPLTEANLTVKRPGTGISPMEWDQIIGRKAARDFAEDELIEI